MTSSTPHPSHDDDARPTSGNGMTRKDLLLKNALVWSSVVLMLSGLAYVAVRLTGR